MVVLGNSFRPHCTPDSVFRTASSTPAVISTQRVCMVPVTILRMPAERSNSSRTSAVAFFAS